MQLKKAIKKGFTLVELVVVIAVIAILAATSVGIYFGMLESANRSADEQAVTQMNKVLQIENILDDVDSILDVHEVFEENGLSTEHYTALAKDHRFYFDATHKKILYRNEKTKAIEYPSEEVEKDHTSCELFSLNMEVDKEKPANYNVSSETGITATVSTVEQYSYVIEEFKKDNSKDLHIKLNGNIDMKGAKIAIEGSKGDVIIESATDEPVTIKNITNNVSAYHTENKEYATGALVSFVGDPDNTKPKTSTLTIRNIIIEKASVKQVNTSGVGIVVGANYGKSITLDNVTVKDSHVVANRNAGALVGYSNGEVTLANDISILNTNVSVTGGRSGLVIGCNANLHNNELTAGKYLSPYYKDNLNLTIVNSLYEKAEGWAESKYPFFEGAFVTYKLVNTPETWAAITTQEAFEAALKEK